MDNSRTCTGKDPKFAVYSGKSDKRATDLKYIIGFGMAYNIQEKLLSGAFTKTSFNTGNPRFEMIEETGFSIPVPSDLGPRIKNNLGKHLTMWVYDDVDHNGTYTLADHMVGTTTGTRWVEGEDLPHIKLTTLLYSAQQMGCQGNESEVCQLKCDDRGSPLTIDMDGDGFSLTSLQDGIKFDLDTVGYKQSITWFTPGSDDALLVMDRNGNGQIDDGGELFGSATLLLDHSTASDGFEALEDMDSNGDGVIDARDESFFWIMLWTDFNHNGFADYLELVPLNQKVFSISLNVTPYSIEDRYGNMIKGSSVVTMNDGTKRNMADIWFRKKKNQRR